MGFAAVIAAALVAIVAGFMQAETGDDSVTVVDPGVEVLVPKPGDIVLRQSQVGVDLAPGYQGTLDIDSVPMPEDQLTLNDALNQVFFQPGDGQGRRGVHPGPALRHRPLLPHDRRTRGRSHVQLVLQRQLTGSPFRWRSKKSRMISSRCSRCFGAPDRDSS